MNNQNITNTSLRDYLSDYFGLDEIKAFCQVMTDLAADAGKPLVERIDAENISGNNKRNYAQNLVEYVSRRDLIPLLLAVVKNTPVFQAHPFFIPSPIQKRIDEYIKFSTGKPTLDNDINALKNWDDSKLLQFMRDILTISQLLDLCQIKFPQVSTEIGANPTASEMARQLIVIVSQRYKQFEELKDAVRSCVPDQFHTFEQNW